MKPNRIRITLLFLILAILWLPNVNGQVPNKSKLTIKEIMALNYVGTPPSRAQWSADSKALFFNWKPDEKSPSSVYMVDPKDPVLVVSDRETMQNAMPEQGNFNRDKTRKLESRNGGLYLINLKKKDTLLLLSVADRVGSVQFSQSEKRVVFTMGMNLYWIDLTNGQFRQLTNFVAERPKRPSREQAETNAQDEWLMKEQLRLFPKLAGRRGGRGNFSGYRGGMGRFSGGGSSMGGPKPIYTDEFSVYGLSLTPDEKHVTFTMSWRPDGSSQGTIVPNYVTRSGYTVVQNTRSKVGNPPGHSNIGILNLDTDEMIPLQWETIPGISDLPDYVSDYPEKYKDRKAEPRPINMMSPLWSPDGKYGVVIAQSADNKDRWILELNILDGSVKLMDRQRDEAWIGGPGISYGGSTGWFPDNKRFWFQSEESGYSHLYSFDMETRVKKALTSGNFEVYGPRISRDKKYWYFTSNEVHPGEHHFYRMPLEGGERTQITSMVGGNEVSMSPDENWLAITFSTANHPKELYIQKNQAGAEAIALTDSRSEAFKAYPWRMPQFITFKAEDGAQVYARLYTPEKNKNGGAVIFVHGAGYLQNAHKWWSTYYHEYMFNNLLVDNGFTVLDMDYRGSSGYGRDWRTGIYRWMGGKDLSDQVDGAKFLVDRQGIDPKRIGIYGGSYGGFITLMAMFNAPDVFAAGAGLRSVTDWAHYNHGYTANILNTPVEDSLAYYRSSPINFAEGLKGRLLMCHGMIDDNVHFQDIVRLTQRLIDLGKENWELAVFPTERHSFTDPDSWTNEYRRIYKLFMEELSK